MYTLSGIHMLETVAKPMLQMLETQRESSTKRVQNLQTKLEQLSFGNNQEEYVCDGQYVTNNDQENDGHSSACLTEDSPMAIPIGDQLTETKSEKTSSMVSSPV